MQASWMNLFWPSDCVAWKQLEPLLTAILMLIFGTLQWHFAETKQMIFFKTVNLGHKLVR